MIMLAFILSGFSLLMSVLLLIKTTNPIGWIVLFPKLAASTLSPYWAIMGAVGVIIAGLYGALWAIPMGMASAGIMAWYVWRCTRDHKGFEKAFGTGWSDQIPPEDAKNMVQKRWVWFLQMKLPSGASWERDITFWTTPDTKRELLCDLWRPANGNASGLAFIYFHGSGWYISNKDFGTRPFFRHLVAQGHTVMDVAYRLCPEVDMYGIIADVKHAIAWMKNNASRYGVDPKKIVLGGGSAGGHLALLAGYAPHHPELTPEDLKSADLSACGIVSYYGPTDLVAFYHNANLQRLEGLPPVSIGPDSKIQKRDIGRMDILLGGYPQDALKAYQLASPPTHVQPGGPPTLLIQGELDFAIPVESTLALYTKLVESGVPTINIVFPWTDHGFDLLFPQVSPAAQSALYDVDRFLALLLSRD